jgi:PAS domain S-box-containing protein
LKEDRSAAILLSLLLDEHLKKIVSVMESYGNRPLLLQAVRNKNAEKAKVHLVSLTKNNPDIDSVIITDRQGTLWAAYPEHPEVLGMNFAYRDWYKGISKEWKPCISDAYLRVVAEKDLAVGIGVPFFNEKGKVTGILQNVYRTVSMSNLINQLPLDPGASISVADRKGQIIYSTRYTVEKEIGFSPFHADMKKALAAKNKTFAVDDHEFGGRTRYISFAPVGNIGWTVFVGRDKRSIFMSEITYYVQVTAMAFSLFLLIILFLFYSRKQVTVHLIQEQLEAEKKLSASQERFKSYIDVTMQLAWTTNDKGEIVEDNPSWSKYTGRGYEAYKGFGWIEDIHPDDRERTGQIWGKAVAEKSFYETEYRVRRYDGAYRDYLARGIPLLAKDGTVREWVGTCIDITERKRAEEALRESEEKFRNLFDNALEGVYQSTPEGRLISVNMAFGRMFGYASPEEMINTITDLASQVYANPEKHAAIRHYE